MLNLLIDVTNPTKSGLLDSFGSAGIAVEPDFVFGDVSMALIHSPVIPSVAGNRPWDYDWLNTDTFAIAIGNPATPPTGGTWPLTINATALADQAWNVSAASLQTALSAASTTAGHGNVTIVALNSFTFQVTWNTVGAVPIMTSGANALTPASSVSIIQVTAGSGSTYAVQTIQLLQQPVAYCTPSTALPAASVAAAIVTAGSGTVNKVYSITLTPGTYDGSYTIGLATIASVSSTTLIAGTASASDIQTALNSAPGITQGDIVVNGGNGVFTVQFQGTQKLSNAPTLAVTNQNLAAPLGVSGVINLNTFNLFLAFAATSANTLTFTLAIQRTRATGEIAEYYQAQVTVLRDLINLATAVPLPLPTFYTAAQVDTLLALKASLDGSGNVLIGTYARLVPISGGVKIQLSADGVTWQDGPSYVAS